MKKQLALIILFFAVIASQAQTRINGSFAFQTIPSKNYSVYIPSTYNSSTPNKMMLGLHPFSPANWNGSIWCDTLVAFAEANNLLLVCPDGGADGRVDDPIDTAFTSALLDSMEVWYNVDTDNVYVMGFSVGGRATYTYGLLHKPRISGLIPIGAAISGAGQFNTTMQTNMSCTPVYVVHGNLDAVATRYTPAINLLSTNNAIYNSILMSGVGHTINFANRNSILSTAYQWIDSVNNTAFSVSLAAAGTACVNTNYNLGQSLTVSGGECPYVYNWSGPNGFTSSVASPQVTAQNGTYNLTVTDNSGATAIAGITLTTQVGPTISSLPDTTICGGDTIEVTISGGTSINWSLTQFMSCGSCFTTQIYGIASIQYIATVTDSTGCPSRDTFQLNVATPPIATISADTSICTGDTVNIMAAGGSNYNWQGTNISSTTISNPRVWPSSSATYTVTVADSNGCVTAPQSITVTTVDRRDASFTTSKVDTAKFLIAANDAGASTYAWNYGDGNTGLGASNTHDFSTADSCNWTVSLTTTNSLGCATSSTQLITDTCETQGTYLTSFTQENLKIRLANSQISIAGLPVGDVNYEVLDLSGRTVQKGVLKADEQKEVQLKKQSVQPVVLKLSQPSGFVASRLLQP